MVNKKLYIFFYTIIFLFLFPIFPHASELTFLYDCAEKTDMHVDNYGSIAIYASNQQDMERVKNILNTMPKQIVKGFEGIDGKIVITDKEYIQLLYYEENGLFYKSQSAAFGKCLINNPYGGEYRERGNTIVLSSFLPDDMLETSLFHEFGHFIDSQYQISPKLDGKDINAFAHLSDLFSPCHNPGHIADNASEAFAESFFLWKKCPEEMQKECETIYNFFQLFN